MVDNIPGQARSLIMSKIKAKDTKIELVVRKNIFRDGFRYRIHSKNLAGKPDIFLKKYGAVIFVNGCFWHGHRCKYFRMPKTNSGFWEKKITKNIENDSKNIGILLELGYRVLVVWECALRDRNHLEAQRKVGEIEKWILSDKNFQEIDRGT